MHLPRSVLLNLFNFHKLTMKFFELQFYKVIMSINGTHNAANGVKCVRTRKMFYAIAWKRARDLTSPQMGPVIWRGKSWRMSKTMRKIELFHTKNVIYDMWMFLSIWLVSWHMNTAVHRSRWMIVAIPNRWKWETVWNMWSVRWLHSTTTPLQPLQNVHL